MDKKTTLGIIVIVIALIMGGIVGYALGIIGSYHHRYERWEDNRYGSNYQNNYGNDQGMEDGTIDSTTTANGRVTVGLGARCGGNMTTAPVCASGLHCTPVPGSHLPFGDVGGTCVKN